MVDLPAGERVKAFILTVCRPSGSSAGADIPEMSDGKPRQPADPMYLLLRAGEAEDFNRRRAAGEACNLNGCNFRGIDLRAFNLTSIDFSDGYFRQADLRGLDLRACRLEGASMHAAHISGTYFPAALSAQEIEMSVRLGTRMRYK